MFGYLTLKIIRKDMVVRSVYIDRRQRRWSTLYCTSETGQWMGMDDQWPSLFFCSTGQYGLVETAPLSTCPASFQAIDLGVDFSLFFCFT
ncbi:hypothetical protein T10_11506 [Trichinella papuae]|uniref:Uncharacterized protein n=1 Tax=Trichinella papuae TaxID=268474 RepID=A0A0V1MXD8_9BILA|nr:hypothetical protein T10_11506 [Trichinella papuae]